MSLERIESALTANGFPRVSGDEPVLYPLFDLLVTFSPRERG